MDRRALDGVRLDRTAPSQQAPVERGAQVGASTLGREGDELAEQADDVSPSRRGADVVLDAVAHQHERDAVVVARRRECQRQQGTTTRASHRANPPCCHASASTPKIEASSRMPCSLRSWLTAVMESFWTLMLPFADLLERLPLPSMRRTRAARARLARGEGGQARVTRDCFRPGRPSVPSTGDRPC